MYSILFNDYNDYGKTGWKVILQYLAELECTWLIDNYDGSHNEVNGFYSYEFMKSIIDGNSTIECRIGGYKTEPESVSLIDDLKTQNCLCAVFCTDQCCFEIYSNSTDKLPVLLTELISSDIQEFEFSKKIYRTVF